MATLECSGDKRGTTVQPLLAAGAAMEGAARRLTPLKAIKACCKDCRGGLPGGPRRCKDPVCPLFPYRLGKDPLLVKELSERVIGRARRDFTLEVPAGTYTPCERLEVRNRDPRRRFSYPRGYLKAIRAHCLWCCLDSYREVRECGAVGCPTWPYRMGRKPSRCDRRARSLPPADGDGFTGGGTGGISPKSTPAPVAGVAEEAAV